jgi:hypothetical protein
LIFNPKIGCRIREGMRHSEATKGGAVSRSCRL